MIFLLVTSIGHLFNHNLWSMFQSVVIHMNQLYFDTYLFHPYVFNYNYLKINYCPELYLNLYLGKSEILYRQPKPLSSHSQIQSTKLYKIIALTCLVWGPPNLCVAFKRNSKLQRQPLLAKKDMTPYFYVNQCFGRTYIGALDFGAWTQTHLKIENVNFSLFLA